MFTPANIKTPRKLFLAAGLCPLAIFAASAQAQVQWNAFSSNWHTQSSWNPQIIPTLANEVQIRNGGSCNIAANAGANTIGVDLSSTLGSAPGTTLTCIGVTIGSTSGSTGTVRTYGTVSCNNTIEIGQSGTGLFDIHGNTTMYRARLGTNSGSTGSVTMIEGALSCSNELIVGNSGTGSLTMGGTAQVSVAGGAGTLQLGKNLGSTGTLTIDGVGSGTLNVAEVSGGLGASSVVFDYIGSKNYATPFTGSLGVTTKRGTTTLSGNNTYTGGTYLNGGTLAVSSDANLGASTSPFTFNGGTLQTNVFIQLNRPMTVNAAGGVVSVQNSWMEQAAAVSGPGMLTKVGTSPMLFTGSSPQTPVVLVREGSMQVSGYVATPGIHVGDSSTLPMALLGVSGPGAQLVCNSFLTVGDNLTGTGNGGQGELTIAYGGTVTMGSGAKLTLGWVNALGWVALGIDGTLQVTGEDGIQKHATGQGTIYFNGGKLQVLTGSFTTSVPVTAVTTSATTVDVNPGSVATFFGDITGDGEIIKTGSGDLNFSSNGSFGGLTVTGGTVNGTNPAALPTNVPYTIHGGFLNFNGASRTASRLSGTGGGMFLGGGVLTVAQSQDSSYAGIIYDGPGSLIKSGAGSLTLSGAYGHSGGSSVTGGHLSIGGTHNGPVSVAAAGNLEGTGTIGGAVTVNGTISPGATPTIPGVLTCNAGVAVTGGTLRIQMAGSAVGSEYSQLKVTSGNFNASSTSLNFGSPIGTYAASDHLFIVNNTGNGANSGVFAGLPDAGNAGTPVGALAGIGGFSEWRIYYHADVATNSLTGGNDIAIAPNACYANCDGSTSAPKLTANDFQCFLNTFAAGNAYANCDGSTTIPVLTANDFQCFLNTFAAGCP